MPITTKPRRLVIPTVLLVITGAVVAALMLVASPASTAAPGSPPVTMASDMPGMDHGDGRDNTPSPTTSTTPPKSHDHSGGGGHDSTPSTTGPTHETAVVDRSRPLAPVLGAFGGASSAVMLSAAFLRRKDRAHHRARQGSGADHGTQE